ncbi:MAG: DCL family protein [Deltaproteobacteria bacterium]|nr:DCL family protein [Deltaproteobacteria bacterium]
MEYRIGRQTFKNKKEIIDFTSNLLHSHKIGEYLSPEHSDFLLDLIKTGHRWASQKIGPGIKAFRVSENPVFHKKCFMIERIDGSETDFSFYKCVYQPKDWHYRDYLDACRATVAQQIIDFKREFFRTNQDPVCEVAGTPLTPRNSHVDHFPVRFIDTVANWELSRGIVPSEVEIGGYADAETRKYFLDQTIADDWAAYHLEYATLRVVLAEVNLKGMGRTGEEEHRIPF